MLVLLQRGKGADAGAGFGCGRLGHGVRRARLGHTSCRKLTAVLATLFFMTSMSLAWFATRPQAKQPDSVVDTVVTEPVADPPPAVDGDAVPSLPATRRAGTARARRAVIREFLVITVPTWWNW